MRHLLDQLRRHTAHALAPLRRAFLEQHRDLVETGGAAVEERPIEQPVPPHHVGQRVGQRGVAARERLQVDGGRRRRRRPDRVDDDHRPRSLRQPVVVLVGRRRRRIRPPHEDARAVAGRPRVEAVGRGPVEVLERHVAGLVADRVGIDLTRAEAAQKPQGEAVPELGEGPGVVGVEDRRRARVVDDLPPARGDQPGRVGPAHRPEAAAALGAVAQQRRGESDRRVEQRSVIGGGALRAQAPAADRVVAVAADVTDPPVAHGDLDAARVVAVARARREDPPLGRSRRGGSSRRFAARAQCTISTSQWARCETPSLTLLPSIRCTKPSSRVPTTIRSALRSPAAATIESAG